MADIQEAKKFVELLIARFHKSCDTIDRDVEEWYNDQRQDDVAYFNLISTHPSLEHREIALATLYKHGYGTSQSTAKAVELYEKASQSGDVYGDCELARYYREKGDGEDDAKRALEYAKKAADGGVPYGYYVAELYIEKALQWYNVAADKGNVQARIRSDEYSKIMAKW
ncbi:6972_t:CDS:2 [Paraglomus occultum]|uniref:6972_t:CDS:1 n=1 Tax=Paraglomus occultum TaxID=144539 RepID=A0A9N9BQU3_9GLOM|nr:6972_t:CDS:2 [Paraglomus occultum]